MVDIDELERLLAVATDGPWRQPWGVDDPTIYAADDDFLIYDEGGHTGADAALIVAARNSLPAILTEIRELRAENARLREAMKGPLAWLERWAVHVGNCETNPECTCGLMFAQHELRAALGEPQ